MLLLEDVAAMDIIFPIVIVLVGIAIAVLIYISIEKKLSANSLTSDISNKVEVALKAPYCTEKEMHFLEYLHRALPKEFIAFPRVGVDQLVLPKKDRVAFNAIMSKYVDVCVYTRKNMEPILVIDLVLLSTAQQQYEEMDRAVVLVLKAVNLPVLQIQLEDAYDIEVLKRNLLNAMPDKAITYIKENYIKSNT